MGYNDWVNGLRNQNASANIPASSGYKQWADNLRAQGAAVSAAQQFLKSDVTTKVNSAIKSPVAGARQLIEADKQRTTIPSVSYDGDYAKAVGAVKTELNLKEKMLLDSAKSKKFKGEDLTVAEWGVLRKFGESTEAEKLPENKSQAYLKAKELREDIFNDFIKSVRNNDDFMTYYQKGYSLDIDEESNGHNGGFLKGFISDYNIGTEKDNTGITDKKLYRQIKNKIGIYKYLSSSEREIYYYLAGKGDNDMILEYINSIKPELESRKAEDIAEENDKDGFWGGVKNTADAATSGFSKSLTDMARTGVSGGFANGQIGSNSPLMSLMDSTYQEKLYSEISSRAYDKNFVYGLWLDIVNNTAAQVPEMIMGYAGGQGAYIVTMAEKMIGASTTEAINEGEEAAKGVLKGLVLAGLEVAPDYLFGGMATMFDSGSIAKTKLTSRVINAIDTAMSNKTVAKLFAKAVTVASAQFGEGLEEFFQEFAEPIVNNLIYNRNEKINSETFNNAIKSFLIGFFSTTVNAVIGANANVSSAYSDIVGSELKNLAGVKSVLDLAEVAENNSDLYYEVKGDFESGRDIENEKIAELYYQSANKFALASPEMLKAVSEKNVDALINTAREYIETKHKNAEEIALSKTTNAISNPINSYSQERQGIIKSFLNSVDEKLKNFVQSVKNGDTTFKRQKISNVSERAVTDIKNLLGIDVSGYTHDINSDSVRHIINRHGENGEHNQTMSSDDDIARLGWVLENYDSIELLTKDGKQVYSIGFLDKEGNPAVQIRYIKRIDGTYYVVEAAVENNYKKLWVQSAYLQKTKEDVTQTAAEGANTNHDANAQSASVSPSSDTTVPQKAQFVNNIISADGENNTQNSVSGAENRPAFTKPSTREIYREMTTEQTMDMLNGRNRTAAQRQLEAVADKFGLKIRWNPNYSRGAYIPETKTIILNPILTLNDAYIEVFKHEFVHYLEGHRGYNSFKRYCINNSKSFEKYVRDALAKENGEPFEGGREEAIKAYTDIIMDKRKNSEEIPMATRKSYTNEKIEREIIADFVGEVLLFGNDVEQSNKALTEIANTDRNLFQKIVDWVKDIISLIKGEPQNRTLEEDIQYLNNRLARVYDSAVTKKAANNSGEVKYSIAKDVNGDYVKVDTNQEIFDGKSVEEMQVIARKFIRDNFKGKILDVGENGKVYVNKRSSDEYAYPANRRMDNSIKETKMRTAPELDNLLSVSKYIEHQEDDGRHPEAIGGWDVYSTRFEIAGNMFVGEVKIMITDRGYIFYDVTKIRRTTRNGGLTENNSAAASGNPSIDSITENGISVNSNSMQESENNSSEEILSVGSAEYTAKMKTLTEQFKNGEITVEQFADSVNQLVESEHKAGNELRQAMAEMQENHETYMIDSARYANQLKKRIKRQDEQLSKQRAEVSREITEQKERMADKQTNIECVRRSVSRIDQKLRANTDNKHVPEELKKVATRLVTAFMANDTSPFDRKKMEDLSVYYNNAMYKTVNVKDGVVYEAEISAMLERLEKRLDGKTLRQLNLFETQQVRTIVEHIERLINDENKFFMAGKQYETAEVGNKAIKEFVDTKTKRENGVIKAFDSSIKYSNMTPVYFFERIGGVFKTLFDDLMKGQAKWFRNVENAKTFIRQIKKKFNYSEWTDDTLILKTEKGEEIEITVEQALLLYATAKREYGNKYKDTEHLFKGGVVVPPSQKTVKDIIKNYKESGELTTALTEEINSRAHRITQNDVLKVFDWLTDEQIKYADAFVEYLSNDMAELGNEVSMQLSGIRKFNENYYIPYNSAANFLYSQPGVTNDSTLKHQSFTKDVTHGANTPLVLSDFSEVCADHINKMCMYNALTIPLDNMSKILNFKLPSVDSEGNDINTDTAGKSVRAELERTYGSAAVKYLENFIRDMNGNVRATDMDKAINRWISKFKKGAVFASASVVVQQPSAIIRAMAYIDPKYFRKTTLKFAERDYQEAVEYAAVAGIKDMGRFDTGVGAATTKWLLQENPEGFKNKTKAFFDLNDSTYRDDKLSYFAAKADEMTWAHIWAATKAEIAATRKDLTVGSEEFLKAAGERFTDVINHTQVYDSTISRSQAMRNKSAAAQMITSFMSEPTVSLNLLMNAVHQAKTGGKSGKKFAGRAVGAFVGNIVLNSLLKSLVTAGRDDDEDKTWIEKYTGDVVGNISSDINPLNLIPFVKDVVSLFEGYSVERADMNLFSDLAQSFNALMSEEKSVYEKLKSLSGSLAAFLGLPVKNVWRDVEATLRTAEDIFANENKTDVSGIKYEILDGLGSDASNSAKFSKLAKAAEKGNEDKYQRMYEHLIDQGKTDTEIRSGLKSHYKDTKEIKKETKKSVKKLEGNASYNDLSEEDKKKIEKNFSSILATEKMMEVTMSNGDKFHNLYEAVRKGGKNSAKYKILKQELIDSGLTDNQIEDGEELAKLSYMKSIGIDLSEYLLFKMKTSVNYADVDGSGGVSNKEKRDAIKELDLDNKTKRYFLSSYK